MRQCAPTGATTQHEPHQQHRCDAAVCKRTSGSASRSTVDVVRTLTSWSLIVAMFQRGGVLTGLVRCLACLAAIVLRTPNVQERSLHKKSANVRYKRAR